MTRPAKRPPPAPDSLGHYRRRAGLTVAEVCAQLLVVPETVRRWERRGGMPPAAQVAALAQVLGLSRYDVGGLVLWWGGR